MASRGAPEPRSGADSQRLPLVVDRYGQTSNSQTNGWPLFLARAFPYVFSLHVAEEWFGGFVSWSAVVFPPGIQESTFLVINGVAISLTIVVSLLSLRVPLFVTPVLVIAGAFSLNGVLHIGTSILFGLYRPGS